MHFYPELGSVRFDIIEFYISQRRHLLDPSHEDYLSSDLRKRDKKEEDKEEEKEIKIRKKLKQVSEIAIIGEDSLLKAA